MRGQAGRAWRAGRPASQRFGLRRRLPVRRSSAVAARRFGVVTHQRQQGLGERMQVPEGDRPGWRAIGVAAFARRCGCRRAADRTRRESRTGRSRSSGPECDMLSVFITPWQKPTGLPRAPSARRCGATTSLQQGGAAGRARQARVEVAVDDVEHRRSRRVRHRWAVCAKVLEVAEADEAGGHAGHDRRGFDRLRAAPAAASR